MKKALIWLIVLLMMSSCAQTPVQESGKETLQDNSANPVADESVQVDESEDILISHNVPDDVKFGGATFNMLSPDEYSGQCIIEETTGDVLNDERYYTQLATEETLEVVVEETLTPFWTMNEDVSALIMAGDTEYGCITMMDRFALKSAQQGYYYPIQNIKYIDTSEIYWGGTLTDSISLGGNLYFAISSFNTKSLEKANCLFINTDIATEVGLEIPYEDVKNGTWTLDKYQSYDNIATRDLDGDGNMTEFDQYTYSAGDARGIAAISWVAAGAFTTVKDEDDIPRMNVQNEKFISVLENVYSFYFDDKDCYNTYAETVGEFTSDFSTGRLLFVTASLGGMFTYRDMENSYSVLPCPKYDELQEQYYSRIIDSMFSMVPTTCTDKDMAGAVLEVMSCIGYNRIVPAYIEESLQKKFARNPETIEMIQLVYDTRWTEISEICIYERFGDGPMYDFIRKSQNSMGSELTKLDKIGNKMISIIMTALEKTVEY